MVKRNQTAMGIDLSDKSAQFCVMTASAGVVAEGKFELTAAKLVELWRTYEGVDVVVLEAGTPSSWVRDLMVSLGGRVVVADPRKLRAVTTSVRKSDVRDARMLARIGLADEELLAPTYVRPPEFRQVMALLKVRDQQVRARTSTVLEIRSQVKVYGSRMPRCDAAHFHEHEHEVPEGLREILGPLFDTLRTIASVIDRLDRKLEQEAQRLPVVGRLTKIDGVGPITALAFVAVVGDPSRFHRTRDIGAYLGLVPRRDQSGESDPSCRITKAGCGLLRRLLTQCAQAICRPRGKDTALRRKATTAIESGGRVGKRKVVVAIARKLAVLMLSIWKSGEDWIPLHRVPVVTADAPNPVVLDECGSASCPSEGDAKSAPSTSTRTHACTGDKRPTKSADGRTGRSGASASRRTRTVLRASTSTRPATPSAPAVPACAGDPADLASVSVAKPHRRRGRFTAEGVPPST
jgi:transposase